MASRNHPMPAAPPELKPDQIVAFLAAHRPFNLLDPIDLERLAQKATMEAVPKGTLFLRQGETQVGSLRVIHSGRAKLFLKDESGQELFAEERGVGQAIGVMGILRGGASNLDVMTTEDTVFLVIPRDEILPLVKNNAPLSQFVLKVVLEAYAGKALNQLKRPRVGRPNEGSLYLFSAQVGDIVRRQPEIIAGSKPIQRAAQMMDELRVGCLLVTGRDDTIQGIVTDRDLRSVLAQGRDPAEPVEAIMASPVQTIPHTTVCFDALLAMMTSRVHHLALEKSGEIIGVLSAHDLMILQGSSPLFLVREISAQERIEGLYDLALKTPRVVHSLLLEGAKAANITRMITLINDSLLDRLLTLLQDELGPAPAPFCWLYMGSEGRREQTYATDQDNGIIYGDPRDEAHAQECANYFHYLGTMATEHLVACGFPRCKGGIMASNPQWCQPLKAWQGYFDRWISVPEPKEVLHSTIFFDFRPGFGDLSLGRRLRDHLMQRLVGQDVFFRFLAKDAVTTPSVLNFFGRFVTEKEGAHQGKVDLKTKGLVPFVDLGRLMGLRAGIRATATLERLQLIGEAGAVRPDLCRQAIQAYEYVMNLRLTHQDQQVEEGVAPDNFIDPSQLSELDRGTLKDAFGVVGDLKSFLREEFQLSSG